MKSGEYADQVTGVRLLCRRELEPVATCWEYQVSADFSTASARNLFELLPQGCEISCFDPDAKIEGYIFIQRHGNKLLLKRGGHGWSSDWKEAPWEQVLKLFLNSLLIHKPHLDSESFTVTRKK